MPFPLAFLVLPLVLHRATRESLPKTTATALHAWLQARPEARLGFAARARQLAPVTREAILLSGSLGRLGFGDGGTLLPAGKLGKGKAALLERSHSIKASVQKTKLVGKWFAEAGEPATVYHMWGVRP